MLSPEIMIGIYQESVERSILFIFCVNDRTTVMF